MRAFLGLGSNLGDRQALLAEAVDSLTGVVGVSSVYETDPVGGPGGQGAYLNLVVELDTDLSARELLGVCHRLESAANRVRQERWGPRTLDVDVISCCADGKELVVREPDLTLPHPLAHLRAFVLVPWLAIDPEAKLTVADVPTPVSRLLDDIEPVEKAGVMPTDLSLRTTV